MNRVFFSALVPACTLVADAYGQTQPRGRAIRARDGDTILLPTDATVTLVRTVEGRIKLASHGEGRLLIVMIDEGPNPDGEVDSYGSHVEASPTTNSEIFYGAIGGYGGVGVITDVTLRLTENTRLKRTHHVMPIAEYRSNFMRRIRNSPDAVLHNGDIYPVGYNTVHALTYEKTDVPVTVRDRLQEYFVPVERFDEFTGRMRDALRRYDVNVINVSIRHATPDPGSLLAWARYAVFDFVIYYKQGTSASAREETSVWARELIDAALAAGGSFYLPYQLHATEAQLLRAYPRAQEFFALKRRLDPANKFRSSFWDNYDPAAGALRRAS